MTELQTFKQFAAANPAITVRKLRWIDQRSRRRTNGKGQAEPTDPDYAKFAPAFVRIGRSVFVDPDEFFAALRKGAGK